MIMKGFIFRIGTSLKDFGEKAGYKWYSQFFINAGISICDLVRRI